MQIVIDIPEVFYEALKKTDEIVSGQRSGKTLMSVIYNAVAKGIPLPKGHGDLIDKSKIKTIELEDSLHFIQWKQGSEIELYIEADTIIEADKVESGNREWQKQ